MEADRSVDADVELEVVALRCPVTQRRLCQPCRTPSCAHAACFCSTSAVHLRVLPNGARECPICSSQFWSDTELVIDARLTVFLAEHDVSLQSAAVARVDGGFAYSVVRPSKRPHAKPRALASIRARGTRRETVVEWNGERDSRPAESIRARGISREAGVEWNGERESRSAEMVQLMVRFVPASVADNQRALPDVSPGGPGAVPRPGADAADVYAALLGSDAATSRPQHTWRCESCAEMCIGDRAAHERTISHLFARSMAATGGLPTEHIALPNGNVGYRMLRDSLGWEEGRGLGKHGEGALQPVPTRLKRDRRGLRIMPGLDDDDDDDGDGRGAGALPPRSTAVIEPLRVTHPSSVVMGAHVRVESRAQRRERRRQDEKRAAYLKRCKELIVNRQMHDLALP